MSRINVPLEKACETTRAQLEMAGGIVGDGGRFDVNAVALMIAINQAASQLDLMSVDVDFQDLERALKRISDHLGRL